MDKHKSVFFNDKWKNIIKSGAKSFGLKFNDHQLDLFATHASLLYFWNKKINITAITNPDEIALKHFIDSIALISYLPDNAKILDIGSGGGFPGFCLKVVKPELKIVMIDSVRKKIHFLNELIRTSKMNKIEAIHTRAEELANNELYKNKFDIVVSRAFSSLDKFINLAKPFLKNNGLILAMKGPEFSEEIKKIQYDKSFNMKIHSFAYNLPFHNIKRSIVKIEKTS